jgi:hypothetical protein
MDVADIGVIIMQRCRPREAGSEPLFKPSHHLSGQFLHIEIAFTVFSARIRTEFQPVKICAFGCILDKLICLIPAEKSCRSKESAGELFFVSSRPLLNVADVGFGRCPLPCPALDIIGSDNRHRPLQLLPFARRPVLLLRFLLAYHPAFDFPDEFLQVRRPPDKFFLGLLKAVVKDVV